jgi:hypothetical protein
MATYYFRFVARPKQSHPKSNVYGGAIINCWIVRESQTEAESYARGSLADEDWIVTELEDAGEITKESQAQDGMTCFEQAQTDREVFVFHRWLLGAKDYDATPLA